MDLLKQLTMLQNKLYSLLEITPTQGGRALKVNIILDQKAYIKTAQFFGVPGEQTDGFCNTDTLEMFILLKSSWFGYDNTFTLFHEFTHLALSSKIIYPANRQPKEQFPFWFTEGMACYTETVSFIDGKAILHPRNHRRSKMLKPALNQNQHLRDSQIFTSNYEKGYSLNDYAMAWGLIAYTISSMGLQSKMALFIREFPDSHIFSPFELFSRYFIGHDPETWKNEFLKWQAQKET